MYMSMKVCMDCAYRLLCVGLNEGVYKHGSVQVTCVGYNVIINVTKDVTIHLRITTKVII